MKFPPGDVDSCACLLVIKTGTDFPPSQLLTQGHFIEASNTRIETYALLIQKNAWSRPHFPLGYLRSQATHESKLTRCWSKKMLDLVRISLWGISDPKQHTNRNLRVADPKKCLISSAFPFGVSQIPSNTRIETYALLIQKNAWSRPHFPLGYLRFQATHELKLTRCWFKKMLDLVRISLWGISDPKQHTNRNLRVADSKKMLDLVHISFWGISDPKQ